MTTTALQMTKSTWNRTTRTFFTLAACVLLAASIARAAGPAVIVSVKGFDELLADVTYLGDVLNQPGFAALPQQMINQITQGQGLKGLDGSKPFGVYITLSPQGQPQDFVAFFPVKDQKEFAATLEKLAPNPEKQGDLTQYQFPSSPNPIMAKAVAKHFFFAPTAESLKETADPAKLVTVPADISIEIDLTQIPEGLKELFLSQTEAAAAANAQNNPSRSEAERQGEEFGRAMSLAGMRRLTMDGARMTLSLDINSKAKATVLDLAFAAKSGTPLASACADYAKSQSPFAGLLSKQTVGSFVLSVPLNADIVKFLKQIVDEGEKSELAKLGAEPAKAPQAAILKKLTEVARSTLQSGRIDAAVFVNAVEGKLQLVAASKVAKGDQIQQTFEDLVKNAPEAKEHVKLNVAQIGKTKVNAISPPANADSEKYFGPGPVHAAFSENTAAVVVGGDSLGALKGVLDKPVGSTPTARPPISIRVGISKILSLVNDLNPSAIPPAVFEQSKTALEKGYDQVGLEISGQPQALKFRLEVQEGVMRLAAIAATQN